MKLRAPWAARATAADRLCRGSALVWQRRADALTAWVRAGRRDDLTGVAAALGPLVRLLLLGVVAYVLAAVVRALPWLMWLLVGCWLRAAWRAGRTVPEAAEDDPSETPGEESPAAPDGAAIRALLLELMGTGSGVHLRTVLAYLQERGQWEGKTVTDMRRQLERLGIPHDSSVKVAGVPTWGVRRRDLEAPAPADAHEPSTEASTAA